MTEPLLRDQRPEDEPEVGRLLTAAFGRPAVAELSVQLADLAGPSARIVAEHEGEIVGQVQLSPAWVDAPRQLVTVLVLSPLGVRPSNQGRGVGGALVRAAIARAESLEVPALFLEGSPTYYPRFGFSPGADKGFSAPSVRIPPPAFQVVTFPSWQDWMIGALVYPDVFWRLDSVGRRGRTTP